MSYREALVQLYLECGHWSQSTSIKADVVGCGCSMLTRGGDTFLGLDDGIGRDVLHLVIYSVEGFLSLAFKF